MKMFKNGYIYLTAACLVFVLGTASAQQKKQPDPVDLGDVTATEIEDLVFMREEEKLARDAYMVLGEAWDLPVFFNIAKSEQKHMDALKRLLDGFEITDPIVDEDNVGAFSDPELQALYDELLASGLASELAALKAGGAIEETDILDLREALERSENEHIINAYENLLCGSRNHLRAFVRQIELAGEVYTPVLMTEEDLNAIVDSPMERGCGGKRQGNRRGNGGNGNGGDNCDSNCDNGGRKGKGKRG